MHAGTFIHETLNQVFDGIHRKRLSALGELVVSALRHERLSVTGLGRGIESQAKEKHCIKKADRLLSNNKLLADLEFFYREMSHQILKGVARPMVLVDWSSLNERAGLYLLRASLPMNGRALTLYEEIHTVAGKEKPQTHRSFLRKLQRVLPASCAPIIITDSGFRVPWFNEVRKLGWDFLGRVAGTQLVQFSTKWVSLKSFYPRASSTPKCLGKALLTRMTSFQCELVVYKARARGRSQTTLCGERARRRKSLQHATRERQPWMLATSLEWSAKKVVELYRTRMQIEEAFRDLKSFRYGLSLELSGTQKPHRMAILVLIGSLSLWLSWIIGKASEILGLHRGLQANTVRCKTVLSPIFLGLRIMKKPKLRLSARALALAQRFIIRTATQLSYC